jgi:hypothetical protein
MALHTLDVFCRRHFIELHAPRGKALLGALLLLLGGFG